MRFCYRKEKAKMAAAPGSEGKAYVHRQTNLKGKRILQPDSPTLRNKRVSVQRGATRRQLQLQRWPVGLEEALTSERQGKTQKMCWPLMPPTRAQSQDHS